MTVEHAPQRLGAAQPAAFGHYVERVVAGFKVGACRLEPHALHEPSRALAARPVQEHNQPPRQRLGDVGAQVIGDHGQRQVDPGGDPGARPDPAVADVQRVGSHVQRRILGLQFLRVGPVRGHMAPVDQPGGGGDEGARTHGGHPSAAARGGTDEGDQVRVGAGRPGTGTALAHGSHSRRAPPMASTTRSPQIRPYRRPQACHSNS